MGWKDSIKPIEFKPSWRDSIKPESEMPENIPYAASAAAGFEQGIPFTSQVGAAGKTAMDVLSGAQPISGALDEYRSERDRLKGDIGKVADANPKMAMLGGLASASVLPIPAGAKGMAAYGGANALSNSKADLTKGDVGEALDDTAMGAATGAVIGDAAEYAGKAFPSVAKYLKNKARSKALAATGATGAQVEKFAPDAADQLLDRKIVRAGDSAGNIADRAQAELDRSGRAIGDNISALASNGASTDRNKILDYMREKLSIASKNSSQAPLAEQLEKRISEMERQLPGDSTESLLSNAADDRLPSAEPLDLAEKTRRGYDKNSKWESNADSAVRDSNKYAANAYRGANEEAAIAADPEMAKQIREDKDTYHLLNPIAKYSGARARTLNQSPPGGLLDTAAATTGAVLGGGHGAAILPALRRGVAPRINSTLAVGADSLSKLVADAPEKLGRFAPMLQEAVTRGGNALAATDAALRKKYPEYSKSVADAMTPDEPKNVLIRDPQGNVRSVPASKKTAALIAGGKLVE